MAVMEVKSCERCKCVYLMISCCESLHCENKWCKQETAEEIYLQNDFHTNVTLVCHLLSRECDNNICSYQNGSNGQNRFSRHCLYHNLYYLWGISLKEEVEPDGYNPQQC